MLTRSPVPLIAFSCASANAAFTNGRGIDIDGQGSDVFAVRRNRESAEYLARTYADEDVVDVNMKSPPNQEEPARPATPASIGEMPLS